MVIVLISWDQNMAKNLAMIKFILIILFINLLEIAIISDNK
jgi:hypothetical protein